MDSVFPKVEAAGGENGQRHVERIVYPVFRFVERIACSGKNRGFPFKCIGMDRPYAALSVFYAKEKNLLFDVFYTFKQNRFSR